MTRSDRPEPATGNPPARTPGEPRRLRTVRLSDAEWTLIEQAADQQGLTSAALVRSGALTHAGKRLEGQPAAALSPGHLALIAATWRVVLLLTTLATKHLRYDDLVGEAQVAMNQIMTGDPDRPGPGEAPSDDRRQPGPGTTRRKLADGTPLDQRQRAPEGPERQKSRIAP